MDRVFVEQAGALAGRARGLNFPEGVTLRADGIADVVPGTFEGENKDVVGLVPGHVLALHSPSGVGFWRASAADNTKHAVGFARSAAAVGVSVPVQTEGLLTLADWTAITGAVSLTLGIYALDLTAGKMRLVAATMAGQVVQVLGRAVGPQTFEIRIDEPILL